jgi:malic enzyme
LNDHVANYLFFVHPRDGGELRSARPLAAIKQVVNPRDLALGYSPGVAAPCKEIVEDPASAYKYGARGKSAGRHCQRHRSARPG